MQAMNRQLPVTFESPFVSNPRVTAICKKKKKKKKKHAFCFLRRTRQSESTRAVMTAHRCTQSLSSLKPQRFAKFKFDFDSASLGSSGRFWTFPCYLFPSLGFG
jgi:hypothetical protein